MAGAPQWTAERTITPADAAALIARSWPEFAGARPRLLAEGWDNTAIALERSGGTTALFRLPRRAIALAGIRRERTWLPAIGPALPIPVPQPQWQGEWRRTPAEDAWPFWGAPLLDGAELARSGLPDEARAPAGRGLGDFLRVLHALPVPQELPYDINQRAFPAAKAAARDAYLAQLEDAGVAVPDEVRDVLRAADELPPPDPAGAVIVHGDLHVRHVLVDAGGRARAVIDWGDLCRAEPSVDLAIAYAGLLGPAREAFFAAYGPVRADTRLRAQAMAVFFSAALAAYAMRSDGPDPALFTEAVAGLARVCA